MTIITRARAALAGDLAATPWAELREIIEGLVDEVERHRASILKLEGEATLRESRARRERTELTEEQIARAICEESDNYWFSLQGNQHENYKWHKAARAVMRLIGGEG